MMRLFTVKRLVFLLAVSLLLAGAYSLFWYGTLRVTNLPKDVVASINGRIYTHQALESGIKLRPGSYTVYVTSPLTRPFETRAEVAGLTEEEVRPSLSVLSSEELVRFVAEPNLTGDLRIVNSRLFENNTWMTVLVGSTSGQTDAFYNIYQYRDRVWTIFDSGTGLDLEESSDNGYPNSVVRYLNGEDL